MNATNPLEAVTDMIACQQILAEDQSVFSVQRLMLPDGPGCRITSEELLCLYLQYVERLTLGIIRIVRSADAVAFRLAGCGLTLIGFSAPLHEQGETGETTVLRIAGGLLVQPHECDRGQLEFKVEKSTAGIWLTLQLADYCPLLLGSSSPSLLRKWLYRFTQAYIHKVVTVRFLRLVYRRLTGRKLQRATVSIAIRKGENI